ncbi:MAG: DUF721 domain-containing protein [Bryobacteraceae bacterium]
MTPASKVLGTLAFPKDSVEREELMLAAWRKAVGKRIAEHARAARLVRTHLIVEVDDAVWKRQLFTLRKQILRNLEKALGPKVVEDVEFRVAAPRRSMQRAETVAAKAMDEADGIADPVMRNIYRAAKRKALA